MNDSRRLLRLRRLGATTGRRTIKANAPVAPVALVWAIVPAAPARAHLSLAPHEHPHAHAGHDALLGLDALAAVAGLALVVALAFATALRRRRK